MYYVTTTARAKNAKRHIAGKYDTFGQALACLARINPKYITTICDGKWNVLCDSVDASIIDTYLEHADALIDFQDGVWSIETPEDTHEYDTFQEMFNDILYTVGQWMDEDEDGATAYVNTKENNEHYKGRVWITKGDRPGKNICLDTGGKELKVIAFAPEITDDVVENAITAMGWNPEEWMNESAE